MHKNIIKRLTKNIKPNEWQFVFPSLIIIIIFFLTDLFKVNKLQFAYSPKYYLLEPYRFFTSHFFHNDLNHLLSNIFGIAASRYFLHKLNINNRLTFILLILMILPIQTLVIVYFDNILFKSETYYAYGFSSVIYGVESFILLSSIYGKQSLLGISLNLKSNFNVTYPIAVLLIIGIIYSFLPGISLSGHISGLIAGGILFLF
tara:strand:+ start:2717 stop:3325 length:609 start_codon:yes stop_codon:yes gene_type:complete